MSSFGSISDEEVVAGSDTLLTAVFRALDATPWPWAVLRGGEESVARGGDVDVLMDQRALDAVRPDLRRMGMAARRRRVRVATGSSSASASDSSGGSGSM